MPLHSSLHKKFVSTIELKQLLKPRSSLLVSFSGGQDSLTLVKLLYDFRHIYQWRIALIHFDHRWRPDSMLASKQVFIYAKLHSLSLYYFECPDYLSTEAASRKWRYATLMDVANKNNFTKIVLAHTATDKAETLMSNLCRGTSLDGLSSISWSIKLLKSVDLIRPILNFYRSETSWFCRKYYLPVWIDRSNYNYIMLRNRLRQELIPYLKSYLQPKFEEKCHSLSSLITSDTDFLEQESTRICAVVQHAELVAVNYVALKLLHISIQSRVLRSFCISNLNFKPNSKEISDMITFINQNILITVKIRNYILGINGVWLYAAISKFE